ncbi:MAG: LysR family transcriptional regulator [Proteobacteria bacterium]|nr:MAG: LysR family transcriptional regulator [Pseudomonadota bacterium]
MHFTIRQLQVFEAVARNLSFTKAAEELHLTQPAVSMQIKQLESSINLPLFEQVGKKIYLTDCGQVLLVHSQRISECLKAARNELNDMLGTDGGRLRIGVVSTVNYFATKLLAEFTKKFPSVQITLDVTNRRDILQRLDRNEPDIVLMGKPPAELDVVSVPFKLNPLVVIASPNHELTRRKRLLPRDLCGRSFVMRETGSGTRAAMERFFKDHGIEPGRSMEMTGNEAIKQAVEAGIGLGVVSRHTIELEVDAGRLVELRVKGFPINRRWYIVHRVGKRLSPTAEEFRKFVLAHGDPQTGAGFGEKQNSL